MRLDKYLISIVILIAIVVAGVMIINEQDTTYSIGLEDGNDSFSNFSNQAKVMNDITESMWNSTQERIDNEEETWSFLLSGGFTALTKIPDMIGASFGIMQSIAIAVGIPGQVLETITIIILISVVFFLIYMFFRFQPR